MMFGEYDLSEHFCFIAPPVHLTAVVFRGSGNPGGKPGEALELIKTMAAETLEFLLSKDKYCPLDFLFNETNPFGGMFTVKFPGASDVTVNQ